MKVDVIILSDGKTDELRRLTQQTVETCKSSEKDIDFNIIVIEQNKEVSYERCFVYYESGEFNYNRFLNFGITLGDAPYIALCNNDLIFYPQWCSTMIDAMQKYNLLSACPVCPHVQRHRLALNEEVYIGHRNSYEMSGWCIMVNRDIFNIIGKLDEEFPFWFADNVYSEQLKAHGIKHGLVTNAIVEHLGSKTLNGLPPEEHNRLTKEQIARFIEKYPDNESAQYFAGMIGVTLPPKEIPVQQKKSSVFTRGNLIRDESGKVNFEPDEKGQWNMNQSEEKPPCWDAHRIDGQIPLPTDLHLDGRVCDCGKLKAEKRWCDCGTPNKHHELRLEENV